MRLETTREEPMRDHGYRRFLPGEEVRLNLEIIKFARMHVPGERGGRSLLPADLPGPLRTLSERTGQDEHSTEGAFGLRRDRRPQPWRTGKKLLPWLLPPAHLPSSFGLRRPERTLDHGALEGGQHPRLQLGGGRLEAHSWWLERQMAPGRDRGKGGRGIRRTGSLRVLRNRGHNLHSGPDQQPSTPRDGRGPSRRGQSAPRERRRKGQTLLRGSLRSRKLGEGAQGRLQGRGDG